MALTAAERAKRYREKLKQDPVKFEEQRKKQLKRLQKSRKKVKDLSEEEKKIQRKQWRDDKKKQKQRKKKENENQAVAVSNTSESKNTTTPVLKIRYKNLCRNYQRSLEYIRKLKTRNEATRKKIYRQQIAHTKKVDELQTEIDKLLARQEILELSLRETYKTTRIISEKRLLKSIALNQVVKNSKSVTAVASCLGIKGRIRHSKNKDRVVNKKIQHELNIFYLRDDISRTTAGKRETKTKSKQKMQIRYLTDTISNLYETYKKEGGKISFTTFYRYKPYYVLSPTAKNRDTCMCIKHSNMEYLFMALKNKHIVDYKNLEETISKSVCDKYSYACMSDECETCSTQCLQYREDKFYEEITWMKWERVTHTYQKSGKECTTKKTVKLLKKGTVRELVTQFKEEFSKFKIHYYNWKEQQRQYQICIKNLGIKEIAILVDFSENYDCKLGTEVQSMHFGASKNCVSLHCGIIYWNDKSQSFVTISDNVCHEPNAIWAHLLPIFKFVKELDPTIETIHFFSDGPTSQYRQKKNFYLINLFATKLKLKYITWSFSESGHGKGVADGRWGAVKRQLDRHVAYGHDVTDANDAYTFLSASMKSVKCFIISDTDIENVNKIIPRDLKAVPQTMKLHQVISVNPGQILYRKLSCFCGDKRGLCTCLDPVTHSFGFDQRNIQTVYVDPDTALSVTDKASYDETEQVDQVAATVLDIDQNAIPAIKHVHCHDETFSIVALENPPSDENGVGRNPSVTDTSSSSLIKQNVRDGDVVDLSDLEIGLNIDDIVDLDMLDDIKDYPQTGFIGLLDTANSLIEDEVECLNKNRGKENLSKRKNNLKEEGTSKKKVKLIPANQEKCSSRSLKTIINRNFTCHLCKLRKLFVITDMTKCIACKNWVCGVCCDQPAIDYICDKCFE